MKNYALLLAVLLTTAQTNHAIAASCSSAAARQIIARAIALQGPGNACARELKRRNVDLPRMCRSCGPFAAKYASFERYVRRHSACFRTAHEKRVLRQLASARPAADFIRRGCGY